MRPRQTSPRQSQSASPGQPEQPELSTALATLDGWRGRGATKKPCRTVFGAGVGDAGFLCS
jgi:hypothetical protein